MTRAASGRAPAFREWRALGFGGCRLALAVPDGWDWRAASQLAGKRIATSYPALLSHWLRAQGIDAEVVLLSGSVEIAPRLGKADAICDLVSSGATLAANQLKPVQTLLESEAVLAGPAAAVRRRARRTRRPAAAPARWRAAACAHSKLLLFQAPRERAAGAAAAAARCRSADGHAASTAATTSGAAGAVPRRDDLAAAGGPQARRRHAA